MVEEWRTVPGSDGRYEVSDQGHIRANIYLNGQPCTTPRHVYTWINDKGYPTATITLTKGATDQIPVHRLVARTFHGEPSPGHEVRHLNGIPTDNRAVNLAWGTRAENMEDARGHGTMMIGSRAPWSKLDEEKVRQIRSLYREGYTQKEIGDHFGVARTTVSKILNGYRWTHVEEAH